jgi:hypothetical protein
MVDLKPTAVEAVTNEPGDFHKEVEDFSDHCAYIRSVFILATRIWRDSTETDRKMMEGISPSFFLDLGQVLAEYVILAACRITDPAEDGKNENLTLETFVNCFQPDSQTAKQLDALRQQMEQLSKKIRPARNKFIAHADRDAIREGKPLGMASWKEWDEFWTTLKKFVRILNEKTIGKPYEIEIGGVHGDAEMLIKSLRQSGFFETLLNGQNQAVRDACVKLAIPAN